MAEPSVALVKARRPVQLYPLICEIRAFRAFWPMITYRAPADYSAPLAPSHGGRAQAKRSNAVPDMPAGGLLGVTLRHDAAIGLAAMRGGWCALDSLIPADFPDPNRGIRKGRGGDGAVSPQCAGDAGMINNIETGMTMAASRKNTGPKHGATNPRRGRPPSKSAQPKAKAAPPARRNMPTQKVAQKAVRDRTQTKRVPSNRTASQVDAALAAQIETMALEVGQIPEVRTELKDLRRLVEELTGMVERLVANQRAQGGDPGPEAAPGKHRPLAEDTDESDTADDQGVPETAESTPSAL